MKSGRRLNPTRREFLGYSAALTAGLAGGPVSSATAAPGSPVRLGVIGCGRRGLPPAAALSLREDAQVMAVSDVFAPHLERAVLVTGAAPHRDWRDLVGRDDVDAVLIAAPDHLHATMAVAAMRAGKDVYCEPPMGLTVSDAKAFRDTAVETGRVVQIGARQTAETRWRAAGEIVRRGEIGELVWSQPAYTRFGAEPHALESTPTPNSLDWAGFLGGAPERPFDPVRFANWRCFWDYSGGPATDAFFRQLAPLLVATETGFPERVAAAGGIYDEQAFEVPDCLVMTLEYAGGHTVVLASTSGAAPCAQERGTFPSRAASLDDQHAEPAVIRGRDGCIECEPDRIVVRFEPAVGRGPVEIPLARSGSLMDNWLECVRTRRPCVCGEQLGFRTTAAVLMGVRAYRERTSFSWDGDREDMVPSPRRA